VVRPALHLTASRASWHIESGVSAHSVKSGPCVETRDSVSRGLLKGPMCAQVLSSARPWGGIARPTLAALTCTEP
jgi:hypothetical protein